MRLNAHAVNLFLIQLLLCFLYTPDAFSQTTPQAQVPVDKIVLLASAACEKLYQTSSSKALAVCKKAIEDNPAEAMNWWRFGQLHFRTEQFKKAEQYFSKALLISQKKGENSGISIALNGLARLYGRKGDVDKASEMFQESMKFCRGEKKCLARNQNLLADLWLKQKVFSRAREWFSKCIENAGAIESNKLLVRCQFGLATVHNQNKEFDKALPLCRSALTLYEALDNKKGMAASLECLISITKINGQSKQWCDYSQQYADLHQKMGKFLQSISLQIDLARSDCN